MALPNCVKPDEFTDWALTSEALEWIAQFVQTFGIQKVIECGSGLSTILFGSLNLERVLSIEHDSNWYKYTRHRLQEKGLLGRVDLQLRQLQKSVLNQTLVNWYQTNGLPLFCADLILVDGPPADKWLRARYPAPHLLRQLMKPGTWLILDDYFRQQETQIVNLWLKEISSLELIKVVPIKFGLAVLRYNGSSQLVRHFTTNTQEMPRSKVKNTAKGAKEHQNSSFLDENRSSESQKREFSHQQQCQQTTILDTDSSDLSKTPLVSIIIPCYNAGARLEACLQSCLQQIYPHLEIIVVDNNSTDNSVEIANSVASTTCHTVSILHEKQQGVNYARNLGFAQCRGDYIQWLDADDELTPNKIALQVAALEQNHNFDIAYGDWEWCFYKQSKCVWRLGFVESMCDDYLLQCLVNNWKPPQTYLTRRAAAMELLALPAAHPQTKLGTDREYFTLAAILGYSFLYVPGAVALYNNWSSGQMTRSGSYGMRVESFNQMSGRFIKYARMQPPGRITPQHWFLLQLGWKIWKPDGVRLTQQGRESFLIQHRQTGVGMLLNVVEARIVSALYKTGGACTIEDHAFKIVRWLWQQVIISPGVDMDINLAASSLAKLVGIPPTKSSNSIVLQRLDFHLQSREHINALVSAIPLYAPLFGEQRLAVIKVLDKLRVGGFLSQIEVHT
ncbi:MAG: glycosyltransferase [Calothrix sp. MO_167.B42]|nr:glycosyltransferase [Calothrix sp. MO_167.B42]